jgi:protein-tyrosine phosphatase
MKILMVCLGNICRSPLAEGILKNKTQNLDVYVDSAGTASYHVGNLPDSRSIEIANKNGIDLTDQRARQFSEKDFDDFDKIYAMDTNNYSNIISLARNQSDRDKVDVILNELTPKSYDSVPDPYYGAGDGFQIVYDMLDNACDAIVGKL